jgi:hypothetical protein
MVAGIVAQVVCQVVHEFLILLGVRKVLAGPPPPYFEIVQWAVVLATLE